MILASHARPLSRRWRRYLRSTHLFPLSLCFTSKQKVFDPIYVMLRLEQVVYNLSRARESAMKRYRGFGIPWEWMQESGYVAQVPSHFILFFVLELSRSHYGILPMKIEKNLCDEYYRRSSIDQLYLSLLLLRGIRIKLFILLVSKPIVIAFVNNL